MQRVRERSSTDHRKDASRTCWDFDLWVGAAKSYRKSTPYSSLLQASNPSVEVRPPAAMKVWSTMTLLHIQRPYRLLTPKSESHARAVSAPEVRNTAHFAVTDGLTIATTASITVAAAAASGIQAL